MKIELANNDDIDEIEKLYDDLNDYLDSTINYAGWKKGVYPVRQTAINGIENKSLFVLRTKEKIAASVILNHNQDKAYSKGNWSFDCDLSETMVVHTLAINPFYRKMGIGKRLIAFIKAYSAQLNMKSIRLDVAAHNKPAISLYEKSGYEYVGTVDLGLIELDTKWFKLYELII